MVSVDAVEAYRYKIKSWTPKKKNEQNPFDNLSKIITLPIDVGELIIKKTADITKKSLDNFKQNITPVDIAMLSIPGMNVAEGVTLTTKYDTAVAKAITQSLSKSNTAYNLSKASGTIRGGTIETHNQFNKQLYESIKSNIKKNVENPYNVEIGTDSVIVKTTSSKYTSSAQSFANTLANTLKKAGYKTTIKKQGNDIVIKLDKPLPHATKAQWYSLFQKLLVDNKEKNKNLGIWYYIIFAILILVAIYLAFES